MFVDFVNSDWWDGNGHSKDRLARPGWLDAFVDHWLSGTPAAEAFDGSSQPRSLPATDEPAAELDRDGLALLLELRGVLRELVATIASGQPVPARLVDGLNRFLDAGRVRHRLASIDDSVAVAVVADPHDSAAIAEAVALSAAEFLASGERHRLKQCDNDGCRWVFYDSTKNASRRWCDSRLCGNVDKVRRYRERQRQQA